MTERIGFFESCLYMNFQSKIEIGKLTINQMIENTVIFLLMRNCIGKYYIGVLFISHSFKASKDTSFKRPLHNT